MKKIVFVLLLLVYLLPFVGFTQNTNTTGNPPPAGTTLTNTTGNPPPGSTPPAQNSGKIIYKITNPLKVGQGSIFDILDAVIRNIIMPLASVLVVLAILYSGFRFVVAQGNPSEIAKAKEGLIWVLVGAAVLLGAYGISTVIKTTVGQVVEIKQ